MAFRDGKNTCVLCDQSPSPPIPGLDALRLSIVPAGIIDGSNPNFVTPEDFVQASPLVIRVYRNGQRQTLGGDYSVSESGGVGTGYDTITFIAPAIPKTGEVIRVDYFAA